jgi:hypothetical protein
MAFIKTVVFAFAAFIVVNGIPQFGLPALPVEDPTGQLGGLQNQTQALPVNTTALPVDQSQLPVDQSQLPVGGAAPGGEEGSTEAPQTALNRLTNRINSVRPNRD